MTTPLDSLRALLIAATGDPTRFQGARYPSGKHSRGRVRKDVKGRIAGRKFVKLHDAASQVAHFEVAGTAGGGDYSSECACGTVYSAPTSELLSQVADPHYGRAA